MTPAQTGLEVSAPCTYREKLFNLLAGQDPIEVLGQTASTLADIVARHPAEVLRGQAIQGKWTPNEIIGHLTDSEWVYGYRLRLILCEDEPAILGFRQDAWVASLRHNEREPSELVEIFRTLRVLNMSVWRRMSPENLQRSGQHNEGGAEHAPPLLRAVELQLFALIATDCDRLKSLATSRKHPNGGSRVFENEVVGSQTTFWVNRRQYGSYPETGFAEVSPRSDFDGTYFLQAD